MIRSTVGLWRGKSSFKLLRSGRNLYAPIERESSCNSTQDFSSWYSRSVPHLAKFQLPSLDTERIVMRHVELVRKGDLAIMLTDMADPCALIGPGGARVFTRADVFKRFSEQFARRPSSVSTSWPKRSSETLVMLSILRILARQMNISFARRLSLRTARSSPMPARSLTSSATVHSGGARFHRSRLDAP